MDFQLFQGDPNVFKRGQEELKGREFDKCVASCTELLNVDPSADVICDVPGKPPLLRSMVLHLRASAFIGKQEWKKAIDDLEKSVAQTPKLAPAHFLLGSVYDQKGIFDKAQDRYKSALENATIPQEKAQYQKVLANFASFIANKQDQIFVSISLPPPKHLNLNKTSEQELLEHRKKSVEVIKKIQGRMGPGMANLAQKNYSPCLALLEGTIKTLESSDLANDLVITIRTKKFPRGPGADRDAGPLHGPVFEFKLASYASFYCAVAHLALGEDEEALKCAKDAFQYEPNMPQAYWLNGVVQALDREFDDAVKLFDQGLENVGKEDATLRTLLEQGVKHAKEGKAIKREDAVQQAMVVIPHSAPPAGGAAGAQQQPIKFPPGMPEEHKKFVMEQKHIMEQATMLMKNRQFPNAAAALTHLITKASQAKFPLDPFWMFLRAQCHMAMSRFPDAARDCDACVRVVDDRLSNKPANAPAQMVQALETLKVKVREMKKNCGAGTAKLTFAKMIHDFDQNKLPAGTDRLQHLQQSLKVLPSMIFSDEAVRKREEAAVHVRMAKVTLEDKNLEKSEELLQHALSLNEKAPVIVFVMLATVLSMREKKSEAVTALDKGLQVHSGHKDLERLRTEVVAGKPLEAEFEKLQASTDKMQPVFHALAAIRPELLATLTEEQVSRLSVSLKAALDNVTTAQQATKQ